jgi:two-component system chemotaxis response regulator CheY
MSFDEFNKLKVLIVDDQQDARVILRSMLGEFGVNQMFEAANGKEADDFIRDARELINFVICDWNMPELSGLEVLNKLRNVDPNIPFLMVTGRGDAASVQKAKKNGVSAYIRKPYSPAQLEAKVRILMQQSKAA